MIYDKIEKMEKYLPELYKGLITDFVATITYESEDRKYELLGSDIYAKVMTYNTKNDSLCDIESHNVYCDIQFSLIGSEGINIYSKQNLITKTEDIENDFYTYKKLKSNKLVAVNNEVGYFTLIHTYEAHQPQIKINTKDILVKKCVIKIKESLFDEI